MFQHCVHQQKLEPLSSELGTFKWDAEMAIVLEEYALYILYRFTSMTSNLFVSCSSAKHMKFRQVWTVWNRFLAASVPCTKKWNCSFHSGLAPLACAIWTKPNRSEVKAIILCLYWWDNWAPNRLSFLEFLTNTDLAHLTLNITQSKINLTRYRYSSFWPLFLCPSWTAWMASAPSPPDPHWSWKCLSPNWWLSRPDKQNRRMRHWQRWYRNSFFGIFGAGTWRPTNSMLFPIM